MSLEIGAAALTVNALMQAPYLFNDPEKCQAGKGSKVAMSLIPVNSLTFDPFDRFWWWDNVSHMLWGITFGALFFHLDMSYWMGVGTFLVLTTIWEVYEYLAQERPWHVDSNGDRLWTHDHAMEDTLLDTLMGVIGVWLMSLI